MSFSFYISGKQRKFYSIAEQAAATLIEKGRIQWKISSFNSEGDLFTQTLETLSLSELSWNDVKGINKDFWKFTVILADGSIEIPECVELINSSEDPQEQD